MKHVDTLTVLKTANSLVELLDKAGPSLTSRGKLKVSDPHALFDLADALRAQAAAMQFVHELPEPAALAAAFRLKPGKRHTKRNKRTPKKPL